MGSSSQKKIEMEINHLNVFVCGDLLNLFINTNKPFQIDYQGNKRYTHPDTHWYFTEVQEDNIIDVIKSAIDNQKAEEKNTVVMLRVDTIFCNQVYNLIKAINEISSIYHPFLLLITDQDISKEEENKDDLVKMLKYDFEDFDQRNLYVIKRLVKSDIREIYMRLFKICSYYNQLGDEFNFPFAVDLRNLIEKDSNTNENQIKDIKDKKVTNKMVLFENNFTNKINFLVIGRPGAGKSAFINKILGEKRCLEKAGKSVTSKILKYNHTQYPIGIYDTPGFENEEDMENIFSIMKKMNKILNEERLEVIHMIIYLINSQDERTLLNTEQRFLNKIIKFHHELFEKNSDVSNDKKLPLIFVYTHGTTLIKSERKKVILNANIKQIFKEDYKNRIFPVELFDEDGFTSFGLGNLFEYLSDYFEMDRISFDILSSIKELSNNDEAQICNLVRDCRFLSRKKTKEEIKCFCHYSAGGLIASTTSIATAIGASPIPFADWFLLTSIQISMIVGIGYIYGFNFNKKEATDIMQSLGAAGIISGICRGFASGMKCIPGIGTIAGIVIDSLVSAIGTAGIGAATIVICEQKLDENGYKEFYIKAITEYNLAIEALNIMKEKFNK